MSNVTSLPKKSFAPINPDNPGDACFPDKLPIELALGLNPIPEICASYGLSKEDFAAIIAIPQFQAAYEWAMEEKMKVGGATRLRCAMMTDEAVSTLYFAMTDPENHINQRAAHAKDIIRLAGHEPAKPKETVAENEKFTIAIQFNESAQPRAINQVPVINVKSS